MSPAYDCATSVPQTKEKPLESGEVFEILVAGVANKSAVYAADIYELNNK